jgi:oxygen-dependent protoporphyrinogen oxidase
MTEEFRMAPDLKAPAHSTASEFPPQLDGLIVGGGISGLSLAHWLGLADRPGAWELWEATGRLGGTTGTDRVAGYSIDWGPNGFLDREPLTLQLVGEVGLSEALEPANESSQKRFIVKHGRLHPVPLSPVAILATGLLSLRDKLRIFMEPLIPARRDGRDESVFDFAARRIGRGAAESFIDPMVSGIFGGLARELSLPACFPIMREMENRYGGLVWALIARQFERRPSRNNAAKIRKSGPAGPGGTPGSDPKSRLCLPDFRGCPDVRGVRSRAVGGVQGRSLCPDRRGCHGSPA